MARAKQTKKIIAMTLATVIATSSVSVVVFAEDNVAVSGDGTPESPKVTVIVTKETNEDGSTTETTTTTTESTEIIKDNGDTVGQPEVSVTAKPDEGLVIGEASSIETTGGDTDISDVEWDYIETTTVERQVELEVTEDGAESVTTGELIQPSTTDKENIAHEDKIVGDGQWWVEETENGKVTFDKDMDVFDNEGNMVLINDDQGTYHQANQNENGKVLAQLIDNNGNIIAEQSFASNMHIMADSDGNVAIMYKLTPDLAVAMVNYQEVPVESIYGKEIAETVKNIAERGYWGTDEGLGSVSQMKEDMKSSIKGDDENGYTFGGVTFVSREEAEAVIDSVSDGDAQVATQAALWAQHPDLNAQFRVSDQEQMAKLNMLYNYLVTPVDTQQEVIQTTDETETKTETVVEDVTLIVYDKDEDAESNKDPDNDNDVYKTDLSIKMVVSNDGTLKVYNSTGDLLASTDISNSNGESTTVEFKDIKLQENEKVDIKLEHVEKMNVGVYVCSPTGSEAERLESYYGEGCLASMIGIKQEVVTKTTSYSFEFDVDENDKTIVKKSSRTRKVITSTVDDNNNNADEDDNIVINPDDGDDKPTIEEDKKPVIEDVETDDKDIDDTDNTHDIYVDNVFNDEESLLLGEEELVAATGDSNHMATGFGGTLAALVGMFMLKRKKCKQ